MPEQAAVTVAAATFNMERITGQIPGLFPVYDRVMNSSMIKDISRIIFKKLSSLLQCVMAI